MAVVPNPSSTSPRPSLRRQPIRWLLGAPTTWVSNVGEPDALPQVTWLRRVAEVAGINMAVRIGPADEQSEVPPFNWAHSMALDTRRIPTELKFAEETSHQQALVRSVLWEREE